MPTNSFEPPQEAWSRPTIGQIIALVLSLAVLLGQAVFYWAVIQVAD